MNERDRNKFYNDERDRFWSREDMSYRDREHQRDRDYRDWDARNQEYPRGGSRSMSSRDFGERGGYPGPFGWYGDPEVDRDLHGRGYERDRSQRDYGERFRSPQQAEWGGRGYQGRGDYRSYQGGSYQGGSHQGGGSYYPGDYRGQRDYRGYQSDWRGDRDEYRGRQDESFGEQLREGAQNIMRKVKRAFRGPKGYKRSDERIREDVNDRLAMQEDFDPSEIEVSVSNSEVTLTGSVRFRHEKFLAEEIADDVGGVTEVHNQLRVQREGATTTPGLGTGTETTQSASGAGAMPENARNRNARAQ